MPVRTGYKIPISLSQNGTTLSNVRNKTLVDYAKPSRTWTIDSGSVSSQPTGNGTWGQTLLNCFQLAQNTTVSTPLLISSGSFTLMIRVRIPVLSSATEVMTDAIFTNGRIRYFRIVYRYDPPGFETPAVHSFDFINVETGTIRITSGVAGDTWYHIAVRNDSSKFYTYLNGVLTNQSSSGIEPWEDAISYFGRDTENLEILDITDFVLLKTLLSEQEISRYAAAPFI